MWHAPDGYLTELQLAERFCADTKAKRVYLRNLLAGKNLLADGVSPGKIDRVKDPRRRNGFHYNVSGAEAAFDALTATSKQSRAGWLKERARNERWRQEKERGVKPCVLRDLAIAEDPCFPSGREGLRKVMRGIRSAKKPGKNK